MKKIGIYLKNVSLKIKIGLVVLLLLSGWFAKPYVLGVSSQAPEYQTATVEKGTLITSVTATGVVSAGSSASITTDATGIVKEVYVANGDTVTSGEKIAEITLDKDSQQKQAAAWASYLSAKNAVTTAKAKMNALQAALFTANQEFVNGAGSDNPITDDPNYVIQNAQWQQAEADYKNQQDVITQAEAAAASSLLSYQQISSTVTAPIAGTVSGLTLTPGLSIAGSTTSSSDTSDTATSQSLGSITLEEGLPQASVNLSEIDVTQVSIGQKVTMTLDAFPDKTFTGKVSAINTNGTTSSGVTTYPVTLTFDTKVENMYPNMAVNATVITNVKNDVLLIPSVAVQTSDGVSTVRVLKNGKVAQTSVEIGKANDTETEITSGLEEGQTVVTGEAMTTTSTGQTTASPFGGTGFGGARGTTTTR